MTARCVHETCAGNKTDMAAPSTSQNISANCPRLAEAGGRLELNLALAGRAGGANWLMPLRDCFRHGDETGHWSRTILNWTEAGGEAPNARKAMTK